MMISSKDFSQKDNSGRISYIMAGVFLIAGILLYSLFQKSVLDHNHYTALAKNQYYVEQANPSQRGQIYAEDITSSDGKTPLATNIQRYSLNVVPKNIKDKEKAAEQLASILGVDKAEIFNKINNDKPYLPPIQKKIDKVVADKIIDLGITGVFLQPEDDRFYPENNLANYVLGFVNADGKGNNGVEGYYDSILKGQSGLTVGEKDTFGRLIDITSEETAKNGTDLILTIERNVQFMAEKKLKEAIDKFQADNGSITIIEPKTGKVLAMAAWPNYNPNTYNDVPKDQSGIFLNPIISEVYEPGSIFKPIIMSFAVNEGKVEPETEGVFSNMVSVSGYQIHTAQDKAFGRETMTQVLENSDNVAMVWVADQLGNETMYNYLKDYGFGTKTGIDMSGETTGMLMQETKWHDINRATISFGQGISVTPMQVTMAIAAIANKGTLMKPYLVDKMITSDGNEITTKPIEIKNIVSAETAKKIGEMMVSVVLKGHGKKAQVAGYKIGGKTGTAQVPRPASEGGGYYEDRHIGSFAGYFPVDDPKFAMLVRLDNPKNTDWAEASAAPTFGEMADWLLNYYQIPPTESQ